MKARTLLPLVLLTTAAFAADGKFMTAAKAGKDLWATMETNKGTIVLKLFSKDAPNTVANFAGLAAGEKTGKPFYDGIIFHRVIPDFMIQGGDPTGTGRGDPGYKFADEFQSGRTFDKVGLLAMANAGPNTNGSQFFITTSTPGNLNNKHTIFGEVVTGYDVVVAIGNVDRDAHDRPNQEVKIVKLTITDKAPAAAPATKPAAPAKGAK